MILSLVKHQGLNKTLDPELKKVKLINKVSETLIGVSLRGDETFDELLEIEKNLKKNKEDRFWCRRL